MSLYAGSYIYIATKHKKSIACGPPFTHALGATVLDYELDTDTLGTFSGEIERIHTPLECAKLKCEWALRDADSIDYVLASEGSFGPDPFIPFLTCNHELLYFIDRKRSFHLHISKISHKTNFRAKTVSSFAELESFAASAGFPSHGLIVRPNRATPLQTMFKGITSLRDLENAFLKCVQMSKDQKVFVQTDMRAHYNPTRMDTIRELACELAERLKTACPACSLPGWGIKRAQKGLPCISCREKTELILSHIYGCTSCSYEEEVKPKDRSEYADPGSCPYCNP